MMAEYGPRTPEERYGPALEKARAEIASRDPVVMASWAGVRYEPAGEGSGYFEIPFLNESYRVSYPEAEIRDSKGLEPPIPTRLILLHYLFFASGVPLADRWIAFRELPGGMGYDAAFQQRANRRLAQAFGRRLEAFEKAARALGGIRLDVGDAAFAFNVLPRVRMAVVLYRGDEEFKPSANVIYDGAAGRYLPTEDLAVLGDILASMLTRLAGS
jgi:hypothetical protein